MARNPISAAPIVTNTDPAHALGPEPVTGKYVTLERLTQKHFPDLWESIGSHPDLWTWWPDEPCKTAADFDNYLEEFLKVMVGDLAIYVVILLSGPHKGKASGLGLALSKDRETNRVAELGLFLGPQLQRSRASTEVAYLLSNLLFESNHRRLQWTTNALNAESRRAAERYGLLHEGTFRQDQINKGRNRDSVWYAVLDSEWPVCKKAFEIWLEEENFDEEGKQKRRLEDIRESLKK